MEMESEIDALVMGKYPVTEEENRCGYVRTLMIKVRADYKAKLIKQRNEAGTTQGIQPAESTQAEAI